MTDDEVRSGAEEHVARHVIDHRVRAALHEEIGGAGIVRKGRTIGMVLPALTSYEIPLLTYPELGVTLLLVESQEDLDEFFRLNDR